MLCGRIHKPSLHVIVERKTPSPEPIFVFRLICYSCLKLNKKPYSITILPEFCIPNGQYYSDDIVNATGYVIEERGTLTDAALRVNVDCNEKTIQLYLRRVISRIENWNAVLLTYLMTILHGKVICGKNHNPNVSTLRKNWNFVVILSRSILSKEESLPDFPLHTETYGYLLSIIQRSNPALGP